MSKAGTQKERVKVRVLCVVPSLPEDLNEKCISSILTQTIPVEMLVVLPKKVEGGTLPEKVSFVLNQGLSHIRIEDFDYVLRVDGDTVLPPNFLEESLKDNPDIVGDVGYAMLLRTKSFLKIMNGKFHPESDDAYTTYKFASQKQKAVNCQIKHVQTRTRPHDIYNFLISGRIYYKLGFEPIHMLTLIRNYKWKIMLLIMVGYLKALVKRENKFDFADFVWHYQIEKTRRVLCRALP